MTLILGIEDKATGTALLACDSGAWKGDQKDVLRVPKVWRSNGWLVGTCGLYTQQQRLREFCPLPIMTSEDPPIQELERAIMSWSQDALGCIAQTAELVRRIDGKAEQQYAPPILLAWGRYIFESQEGSAVTVERGFSAIGVEGYALGAFEALRASMPGAPRVALAGEIMRAVYRCTRAVEPPFRWFVTGRDGAEGVWQDV